LVLNIPYSTARCWYFGARFLRTHLTYGHPPLRQVNYKSCHLGMKREEWWLLQLKIRNKCAFDNCAALTPAENKACEVQIDSKFSLRKWRLGEIVKKRPGASFINHV
jgi:hypothetical protein